VHGRMSLHEISDTCSSFVRVRVRVLVGVLEWLYEMYVNHDANVESEKTRAILFCWEC
jgi:hypothetical protein